MKKTVTILLGTIALILGLFVFNFVREKAPDPTQLHAINAYVFDKPRIIEPFQLTDHRNQTFSNKNLHGKWTLVYFGFTFCPDICPTTLATLNHALTKIGLTHQEKLNDLQVILVTVDPARDNPEKLASYVTHFNPNFIGLTGSIEAIDHLAKNLNISFAKAPGGTPETYVVDHSDQVVLINPRGDYYGFIRSPHTAEHLMQFFLTSQAVYHTQQ